MSPDLDKPDMTIRLSDLSTEQIRQMVKLDDGFDHIDSVGVLEAEMTVGEFWHSCKLKELGLVERIDGREGQVWYRLSEAGRAVREEGHA